MDVGGKIRYYRKKAGFTQRKLAEKLFVTERTIGNYETGFRNPSLFMLEQIAHACSIPVEKLVNPIEKEVFLPEQTKIFHLNQQGFAFLKDYENEVVGCEVIQARMGKNLVYIPVNLAKAVIQVTNHTLDYVEFKGKLFSVFAEEKAKPWNGQYVLAERKESTNTSNYAIQVDEAINVVNHIETHQEMKKMHEEGKKRRETLHMLHHFFLNLSLYGMKRDSKRINHFSLQIKEFSALLEMVASPVVLEAKAAEIFHLYHSIPDEEKKKVDIFQQERFKKNLVAETNYFMQNSLHEMMDFIEGCKNVCLSAKEN